MAEAVVSKATKCEFESHQCYLQHPAAPGCRLERWVLLMNLGVRLGVSLLKKESPASDSASWILKSKRQSCRRHKQANACPRGAVTSARQLVTLKIVGSNPIGGAFKRHCDPTGRGDRLKPGLLRVRISPVPSTKRPIRLVAGRQFFTLYAGVRFSHRSLRSSEEGERPHGPFV